MRTALANFLPAMALLIAFYSQGSFADPWDLRDFDLCSSTRLKGIKKEASGVTYCSVTNSIWVITRRPPVMAEYSMSGKFLRKISHEDAEFRDPEGITWMYDYTFAVATEGTRDSGYRYSEVTIVDASPHRREVKVIRRVVIKDIDQKRNMGLESVTWDPDSQRLLAGQEMKPMQVWEINPRNGKSKKAYDDFDRTKTFRDLAGMYKRAGDRGLYVLSEPTKTVFRVDRDGDKIGREEMEVKGKMPEGLTFTPDGQMMIIVSEPREMYIYSVGSCRYKGPADKYLTKARLGDDDDDRRRLLQDSAMTEDEEEEEDEEPENGFVAVTGLVMDGISSLGEKDTIRLQQAVSSAIFGVPDGHLMVSVEPGTSDAFDAHESTQSLISEEQQQTHALTLKILAETHYHAAHLKMNLDRAIESGALLRDLRSSDSSLRVLTAITVSNNAIISAGMSPQMYPSISASPTPEDFIPEVVAYFGESDSNAVHGWMFAAAVAAGAAVVVCLSLVAVIVYRRNRAERQQGPDSAEMDEMTTAPKIISTSKQHQEDDEAENIKAEECRVIIIKDKAETMP